MTPRSSKMRNGISKMRAATLGKETRGLDVSKRVGNTSMKPLKLLPLQDLSEKIGGIVVSTHKHKLHLFTCHKLAHLEIPAFNMARKLSSRTAKA